MRLILIVLVCLGLLGSTLCKSRHSHNKKQRRRNHQNRILGGTNVTIENYNYVVSLLLDGKHSCGGTIITPSFILTPAHCTIGHNPESLSVRAGSGLKNSGGVVVKVETICQHPNYIPDKAYFDISVIELQEPLTYGKSIGFIDLPYPGEEVYSYVYGSIAGWGDVDKKGTKPDQLNAAVIATLDQFQCQKFYSCVSYLQFCAGSSLIGAHGPCMGDSGAPFVVNGKLVGIASYSSDCSKDLNPTVFTKISTVRTFISAKAGI